MMALHEIQVQLQLVCLLAAAKSVCAIQKWHNTIARYNKEKQKVE